MNKRAEASVKKKAGAFVALVAMLLQAFLFVAVSPQTALAGSQDPPQLMQSICGTPPSVQTGSHNSQHTLPDCRLCPLCLSVLAGTVGVPPQAPGLPIRYSAPIHHGDAYPEMEHGTRVAQAAQPRGPPARLQNS